MRERKLASDDHDLGKFSRQPQGPLWQEFELVRGPIKPFISRAADAHTERNCRLKRLPTRQFAIQARPGFLGGKDTEEAIRINPEDFYAKHGIELKLDCEVTQL